MTYHGEVDITIEEAKQILEEHGGYGSVRIYFVYSDVSKYPDQIGAIKSVQNLDEIYENGCKRLYAIGRSSIPIRKA